MTISVTRKTIDVAFRRLLAVDDDPFYRRLYTHFGHTRFEEVITVEHASQISTQALTDADVLILDLDMPETDGMQFLTDSLPRSIALNPELHVIICSGMDPRIVELARRAGNLVGLKFISLLHKPFTAADLQDALALVESASRVAHSDPVKREDATIPEVEGALLAGEIIPYWQPQIATQTGLVSGVEILSRWHHPTHGVLTPEHFINAMESEELGIQYALRLLESALISLRRWETTVDFSGRISLNVPPAAITHPKFTGQLLQLLQQHDFPDHRLVLELTEHTAALNKSQMLAGLARIMMHKIQLSLDDFGTGHSSLDRLGTEAFSELKIDRSFLGVLGVSGTTQALARSIIQSAKASGLRIVAEGVQDALTVLNLSNMGCTELQGSYFTMPLSESALLQWFKDTGGYFPEARYSPQKTR